LQTSEGAVDLHGVIELHVHAGPDVRPRKTDALTLVRTAKAAGMRALLLKSHDTITADLAQVVESALGGFNAEAVPVALARSPRSQCPFTVSRFLPPSDA
jgi:hypothetical protein